MYVFINLLSVAVLIRQLSGAGRDADLVSEFCHACGPGRRWLSGLEGLARGRLGRLWRPSGGSWGSLDGLGPGPGALWAALGRRRGALQDSWAGLGASRAALGGSWAALGTFLAAFGRLLERSWGSWAAPGTLLAALGPGQTRTLNFDDSSSENVKFR